MLARAATLPADVLILDLEDSVPPEAKDAARERVARWLASDARRDCRADVLVRINPLDDAGGHDLQALFDAPPLGFMLPKIESRTDLERYDRAIGVLEQARDLPPGSSCVIPIATEATRGPSAI